MTTDQHVADAMAAGERNREVIELLHNWCGHARVEIRGGVGLVEQMTDLPIGMRRVCCVHQRVPGNVSMHMSINALHFYDRNCVGCTERQPVRLPNLTQLVAERDAKLSAKANAHAAHAARDTASRARRASGRELSRVSASLQSADVLDLLDLFDAQPTQANASLLVESARAVPSAFTGAVLAHLYEVADAGGADRTTGALAVLDLVSPDRVIHARIALRALARGEAVIEAARVFATCLSPAGQTPSGTLSSAAQVALDVDASLIPELDDALPTLVSLAAPKRGWRPWEVERPAHPSGFLAALQLLPEHAHIALRRALRSEHALWRTAGAHVVVAVLDARGIADALPFTADLIAGFSLPEDRRGDNHAMRTLAWALAELMEQAPTEIEGALARAAALGGVRERLGVVRTYVAVLEGHDERSGRFERRAERQVRQREPTAAEALVHQRLIETLARLPDEDEVVTALEAVFRLRRCRHGLCRRCSGSSRWLLPQSVKVTQSGARRRAKESQTRAQRPSRASTGWCGISLYAASATLR